MIINNNIAALNANRVLKQNNVALGKDMEKLASGLRITRAGDDASGLAVSEKMRSQIRGLNQASRNAQDGISLIQTAEGYLGETTAILQRIRELAIQSSNGIYDSDDRMQIQVEVSQLIDEVDRIASHAQFNGFALLTGRFAKPVNNNVPTASIWFHLGANMDQRERIYIGTMSSQGLGLKSVNGNATYATFITVSSASNANLSIALLDGALNKISKQRAALGAYQNRLESTIKSVEIGSENLQAAESRIRDANMAKEMSNLVKNQVLAQASQSMLAQANMQSQQIISLLQ